jgi:hypothetical protein
MGRGFGLKGQICVYCNESHSTKNGDHLLARSLLSVSARNGAPKIPCCEPCNRQKSGLEQYLASVLPLASREHDAAERAVLAVNRVAKNRSLGRSITKGVVRLPDPVEDGAPETFAFPFEPETLLQYSRLVTIGLLYWTTGTSGVATNSVRTLFARSDDDIALIWKFLFNTDGQRVSGSIGGTGLMFDGLSSGPPHALSAWRLSFLNGACFVHKTGGFSNAIWSFVAPDWES